MAFICEDVGTTKRKKMTPTKALRIFEAHKGICVLSGRQIMPGDDWFIEHIRALELGGADDESNMGPALYEYKGKKDAADHSAAAKAKRVKRNHLGIKDPNRKRIPQPPRAPKKPSKPSLPPINLYRDAS